MPAFSSPIDCTPWVIGGLWPAELSTITDENAPLAEHLRADLQRITSRANDELKMLKRAGMDDAARHAAEARAINEARAHAARRVESAIRHLRARKARPDYPRYPPRRAAERFPHSDRDKTEIIPVVPALPETSADGPIADRTEVIPVPATEHAADEPAATTEDAETAVIPKLWAVEPVPPVDDDDEDTGGRHRIWGEEDGEPAAAPDALETPAPPEPPAVEAEPETTRLEALAPPEEPADTGLDPLLDPVLPVDDDDDDTGGRHRIWGEEDGEPAAAAEAPEPEAPEPQARPDAVVLQAAPEAVEPLEAAVPLVDGGDAEVPESPYEVDDETGAIPAVEEPAAPVATESDTERLQRILAFVVRQEPQLNWAVGDRADGTTVLVTDLAHGWIPSGITLPAGVQLLAPARRTGKASAMLGETTRSATYTPGDPVGRPADFAATEPSVQARELPAVDDMGWELGRVTHWRDGLPRLVHTLAKAATAGTGVVEEEADLLRVHLDTARYQVLTQYPDADPALLLNCLLLAATESSVAGDPISANYHLAWFQKLNEPPASRWSAES
ncbi:hypothetical protein MNAB215_1787 [Mycobacterium numidiamassiliense]|uniref:Transmembrane protein n=1 Tax=Mycobacterium numidiamassiliense TaxID=1841861 RepID=A0A2U3P770_9MYCO|nr:hypothetical protein MNAB215_1766 [Mycobacterium numidiamassiliense]SPM39601.1 hypothetical protein MNAB215_1787 [Mycobacterium numidiamassiliense]